MATLELIDKMTQEICKIRGIDLPPICIKILILTYIMYAMNTFDVKYQNENNAEVRINGGCLILCQKGTGKSRTLKILKQIFKSVDRERQKRYENYRFARIGAVENKTIPLTKEDVQKKEEFLEKYGTCAINIFEDTITQKALCEIYGMMKDYGVHNILFNVDEVGDRVIKEYCSPTPSLPAKDFIKSLNQLFDGYCAMEQSSTSRKEKIKSQEGVGANFIFVSTAEFLKDFRVQQKYRSVMEGGLERRLLYINCPPIDQTNTNRKRIPVDFTIFEEKVDELVRLNRSWLRGRVIPASENLWQNVLETRGAGSNLTMAEEFLLLLFSTSLAAWTLEEEISLKHWNYMVGVYKEIKSIGVDVVKVDTTNYDRICIFIKEKIAEKSNRKKLSIAFVKDFCVRNHFCYEERFKKWFSSLLNDFSETNSTKYLIQRNQTHVWLEENFAYEG